MLEIAVTEQQTSTTLRYYRSTDSTITINDTLVASNDISSLSADSSSGKSASVTGHSSDTAYYGACVVAVSNESNTANNCSNAVAVEVTPQSCTKTNASIFIDIAEGSSCTITSTLVEQNNLENVDIRAGSIASCSRGRIQLGRYNFVIISYRSLFIRCNPNTPWTAPDLVVSSFTANPTVINPNGTIRFNSHC